MTQFLFLSQQLCFLSLLVPSGNNAALAKTFHGFCLGLSQSGEYSKIEFDRPCLDDLRFSTVKRKRFIPGQCFLSTGTYTYS
jgi:hypothetical protein